MSATEELRRMLDERGVEWRDSSDKNVLHTTWNAMNCWFNEFPDGWTSWGMAMRGTPEQAIEATIGRTCRMLPGRPYYDMGEEGYTCSECGSWAKLDWVARYCPNCGAKVVEEGGKLELSSSSRQRFSSCASRESRSRG